MQSRERKKYARSEADFQKKMPAISIADLVTMLRADAALQSAVSAENWQRLDTLFAQYTVCRGHTRSHLPAHVCCIRDSPT
jgi:hypothetical protein